MMGMGDYSDSTQCSEIPSGDPYRRPGNYCATPDGGITTFNADGSTYRAPGYTVDPDPAHPAGSSGGGSSSDGVLSSILRMFAPPPPTPVVGPGPGGMSTGTMVMIAGGVVVLALVLSRR